MNKKIDSVNQQVEENNGNIIGNNNGVIFYGMNYADVRNLCLDLIGEEINKAKQVALVEAQKRNDDLVSQILKKCANANIKPDDMMRAFVEPSLQLDFIEAEKAYIKYGTTELKDLLSHLIVKRIKEPNHNLLQIVLGEAIKTSPLLLPSQINCLGLKFILGHTRRLTVNSHSSFAEYLNSYVIPIYEHGVSEKESDFQHLIYARCATVSIASYSLENIFLNNYTGLFLKGFEEQSLALIDNEKSNTLYPTLFTKCLNNNEKLQIDTINEESLNKSFKLLKVKESHKKYILSLFNSNKMNEQEVKNKIIEIAPKMESIFKYWQDTLISKLILSSVGIIIGAFAAENITNSILDLSIWI